MKILKPIWVKHEDKLPIFSVDIHPDGTRFATGGQGDDTGRVVIWNMAPVLSEAAESDENIPKILCQLDNHLACVNCVRWSFMGQQLASAGDDKLIMVWKQVKSSGGSTVFGSSGGKVNVEAWRCTATLRAHNGDVLDLAWSANDAWLASCSVDNTVIVWNAQKFPEQVAVLNKHSGLVKGVAWDPVGKYLSSQSEDKTLRIWRTVDWKEERVIKEPFEKCSGTTHVLRLCWSPDGQYLVSAHARNGPGPTAQIIERKGWLTHKDFVGHRKPVTCARFSQVLLRQKGMKNSQYSCCCALGSRDESLSVWLTSLKRPLVVINQLFTNAIHDVAWSADGMTLMACSQDGTLACLHFTKEELGQPFTHEQKIAVHEKKYGKSLLSSNSANWSRVSETPEMLLYQEENQDKEKAEGPKKNLGEDRAVVPSPIKGPINKQIEVRTADGRRRITPMFIPPTPDTADATSQSNMSSSSQPTFFSSESKSRIIVERRDDIVEPNVARVPSKSVVVNGHGPSKSVSTAANDSTAPTTKDTPEKSGPNAERTPFAPVTFGGKRRAEKEKEISGPGRPNNAPAGQSAPTASQTAAKRPRHSNIVADRSPVSSMQDTGPLAAKPDVPNFVLPALRISKSATEQVSTTNKRQRKWVEVENNVLSSGHGSLSRVRLVSATSDYGSANSVEWESIFGVAVSGVAANAQVAVVTCDDATLHVLDLDKGQYKWPAFVLRSPASRLALNSKSQLMVVTACGHLTIWDLENRKVMLRNESMVPIIYGDSGASVAVLSCSLSEEGTPMVSLSSGKAFIFDMEFGCWMVMGNSRDPVSCNSIHQSFLNVPVANSTLLPLACLQSDIRSCGPGGYSRSMVASSAASGVGPVCSLAFLDRQLAACRALRSPTEYRHWLLATVRFLMHYDLEKRLRNLCDNLLGPAYVGASASQLWDKLILGVSKHSLLKEVLRLLASDVRWQRLFVEYSEQLRNLDEPVMQ